MKNHTDYFKNKKITVMGLGLLGRGIGYTKFLAECGAELIVTDLKTKEQLATSLDLLKEFPNITFVLGEHRLEDFRNRDMIIKAAGVPLDSLYIEEARKNNIPIEMDASLFAKLASGVTIVGITGTRGKSTTTMLIYEILSSSAKATQDRVPHVFLGGNIRGMATLPLLNEVQEGDIVVLELDSWQLQGFGEAKISPHVSVFTSFMPDHMNYYSSTSLTTSQALEKYFDDKANIFKYQTEKDFLVIRPGMIERMKEKIPIDLKSKLIIANPNDVKDFECILPGEHNRENLAAAVEVAKLFNIPDENIRKAVLDFKGVEGRLQLVYNTEGIKIYNDNNATTPEAAIAGLEALGDSIILICGGADKKLDLIEFVKKINQNCKAVILTPGSGTESLLVLNLQTEVHQVPHLKEALEKAISLAVFGDTILFSPAFASFAQFNNEYERNDLFMKLVKELK